MARSKWISFGAQQPVERAAKAAASATPPSIPIPSPADAKKFGLENFGNTCYANSVLQALYFCSPFRDLLLQDAEVHPPHIGSPTLQPVSSKQITPVRRKPERKPSTNGDSSTLNSGHPIPTSPPSLFSALRSLFLNISTNPGDKGTVAPRAFIDKLKELNELFRSTMHQDAHEFLNYLLNQIVDEIEGERKQALSGAAQDDLSSSIITLGSKLAPTVLTATNSSNSGAPPSEATLVHRLFEGVLTSETRCLTCETVSSRDEAFLDLSIDIEQNSSVTACLRQFSASEMLCQKNKFFCDSCCDLQEAEKRMKIKKLPNVLALHLKRFKYQEDLGRYIKLAYRVAFPFELRLFNTVDDMEDADRLYNLFAIVVHIGNGPHHGHYISIIRTAGNWFVFDDDNVYPLLENDIPKYFGDSNSGSAYVLYYQAVDIDLPSLGLRAPEPEPQEPAAIAPTSIERSPQQTPVLPPGLTPSVSFEGRSPDPSQLPVVDAQQPTIPSHPFPDNLSTPASPSTLLIPHVADQPPLSVDTPNTPTSFGNKFFSTIRRAPSMSATRSNGPSNASEHRRSGTDKSPRPSTSVPSFVSSVEKSLEPPPPLPPLPPVLANNHLPSPITPTIPQLKEPDNYTKDKDEKEKKEKKGNWFTKKRKSLRIGDKADKAKRDSSPTPDIPQSPFLKGDDLVSKSTSSTGSLGPSVQRGQDNGVDPASLHPDSYPLRSKPTTPTKQEKRLNGHESQSPGSGSSSPSSTSLLTGTGIIAGSTTRSSTSNSFAVSHLEFPPPRKASLIPSSEWSRASVDRKRSLDLKAFASGNPAAVGDGRGGFSPSPPPVRDPHPSHVGNGHILVDEPESMYSATSKGKSRSSENDRDGAPPTSFAFVEPVVPQTFHHPSLSPDSPLKPLRSTTSPPPSMAMSIGANTSVGSNHSTSSNLKRATRKLSLTAPMLGFGKRDKEKPS